MNATDTTTTTTTAYGFPVEKVWRESTTVVDHHGRIRFYTVTLDGLEVNRKRYETITVEYVREAGRTYVSVSAGWQGWSGVTDSAREKIQAAAQEHVRELEAETFGTPEAAQEAVRELLREAAREGFQREKHRGSLAHVRRIHHTNRARWEGAAGARLTDDDANGVQLAAYADELREHVAKLQATLDALS